MGRGPWGKSEHFLHPKSQHISCLDRLNSKTIVWKCLERRQLDMAMQMSCIHCQTQTVKLSSHFRRSHSSSSVHPVRDHLNDKNRRSSAVGRADIFCRSTLHHHSFHVCQVTLSQMHLVKFSRCNKVSSPSSIWGSFQMALLRRSISALLLRCEPNLMDLAGTLHR